ncbi:MAG: MotA/TolQ/ExbB proton channel family protein [Planctomycetota bacterium]
MNIKELFIKGGIVMWPLLICSVISIAVILERGYFFLFNMRNTTKNQKEQLEKNMWLLFIIATIAPLLGLLGTITGLINVFLSIHNLNRPVTPQVVAGGLWEAMITTAYGLIIAIPDYFFYYYFIHLIKNRKNV